MCRRYGKPPTPISVNVFQICSSTAFGLASPPASLKPPRPRPLPGGRNESTAISESLRAVECALGKKPGALSVSELSHAPVRVDEGRLADSSTDGIELLSLCGDSQSYCGTVPTLDLGRVWEESRAVYSRFVHARFERALQAISGLGPVHTAGQPLIKCGCRGNFSFSPVFSH